MTDFVIDDMNGHKKTGVMLVGHGTRDETGTQQFFELGERLAEAMGEMPVVACLLEFQEPTIPQAWDQLVQRGVQHVHVAPLLLFAAGHAKRDIPDLIAQCQKDSQNEVDVRARGNSPSITCDQSGPLSRHASIIELISQRISKTCDDRNPETTALVMVGRGSYDPCAQADMRVLTAVVAARNRFAHVATAFYAMAQPKLPDVLDRVAGLDGIETVVVQPHLLFEGRLYQAIKKQVAEAAERNKTVDFLTGDYLGPEPQVAQAIIGRLERK